jgi:hypothetical protein
MGTYNHSLSAIDTECTDTLIKGGEIKQDNTRFRCDKPNVWTKLHIDSPSVARGLQYFSTQES